MISTVLILFIATIIIITTFITILSILLTIITFISISTTSNVLITTIFYTSCYDYSKEASPAMPEAERLKLEELLLAGFSVRTI